MTEKGIDAGLHKAGCLGMCYAEPLVDIIKPGEPRITYSVQDADKVKELVKDYHDRRQSTSGLALGVWVKRSMAYPTCSLLIS